MIRKLACPCGRCTVSGEEATVRRRVRELAVQCGGCGRVLLSIEGAPLVFMWLRPEQPNVWN